MRGAQGVTAHYVMTREEHNANQARQRELIRDLADLIMRGAPARWSPRSSSPSPGRATTPDGSGW
nr:hypothetical protein GCM10020093_107340 [Planobispora longispora]